MARFAVGLDLSLTSSGVAAIDLDTGEVSTALVKTKGKKTDRLPTHAQRCADITHNITALVDQVSPEAIALETAYFSTKEDSSAHRRAGMWWSVVLSLIGRYPIIEVSPTGLKKFATGKGNATKPMMVGTAVNKWGRDVLPDDNSDRADAVFLASFAAFGLGGKNLPIDPTEYRKAVSVLQFDNAGLKSVYEEPIDGGE